MKTIEELRTYLIWKLPESSIYLFGSRARGDAEAMSDIDIAVESDRDLHRDFSEIRSELEESLLPFKVDLIDLRQAPYLKETVEREGLRWH